MGRFGLPRPARSRTIISLTLLLLLLVICSLAFIPSHGWAKLGWQFFGYLGLFLIYKFANLKLADIGLSKPHIKSGLIYGACVAGGIFAVFIVLFLVNEQAFQDSRYRYGLLTAVYASAVLLPLKTVLFEELAFRGLLLGLVYKVNAKRWPATVMSSIAFGLWHLQSAGLVTAYDAPKFFVIAGVVVATSTAGMFLCELRWRSRSLLAPIVVHWFANGLAIILSSLSWHV